MELEHLAYSGIAEFARQWILLSRRKKYEGDGWHELWVVVGGSAGQSGLYAADVNEGLMSDDFTGRVWDVEVQTAAEVREDDQVAKGSKKEDVARERNMRDDRDTLAAIDAETSSGAEGQRKPPFAFASRGSAQRRSARL